MRRKTQTASALRMLRKSRCINQDQLAVLVGVSQQTISKAERGIATPSKPVQELIAAILGSSPRELFPEAVAS